MTEKFIIQGGNPLEGEIEVQGSKNEAGPVLAAVLLTKEDCIINNLPLIEDIKNTIDVLGSLGVKIEWIDKRKVRLKAQEIYPENIDFEKVSKARISVLFFGSLLARSKNFKISNPGGDQIGLRPISVHLKALEELGAEIKKEGNFYYVFGRNLTGKEIILGEFSPTATASLMMAAVMSKGKTIIKGAASELSVQSLGSMLSKMGAKIKGCGSHVIEIEGVDELHGCSHTIDSDNLEAGTFIVAGALTPGKVVVKNINFNYLDLFLYKLKEIGVKFEKGDREISVWHSLDLKPTKVQALPYPGFPTDLIPIVTVLLIKARGRSLVHDPLYENRFGYMLELRKMGADIEVVDPHRAFIFGPKELEGNTVNSLDIRAGAVMVLAGLVAKGQTVIKDVFQIDRGYERIEEKLKKLGADIKRIVS